MGSRWDAILWLRGSCFTNKTNLLHRIMATFFNRCCSHLLTTVKSCRLELDGT
jgi:hypothetical protein